jgi:hypothetical protein
VGMEALVSLVSSLAMLALINRARRWAKSGAEAAVLGTAAGVLTAVIVALCVVATFLVNQRPSPLIDLRIAMSVLIGPASGALMTVMLWRRAQSR